MSVLEAKLPSPSVAGPSHVSAAATVEQTTTEVVEKKEEPWKRYYEAHKEQVLAIQKEKKRWLTYYERHQDEVRERNRMRYYAKAGRDAPPRKERKKKGGDAPTDDKIDRLAALLAEMRELIPGVLKPVKEFKPRVKITTVSPDAILTPANEVIQA